MSSANSPSAVLPPAAGNAVKQFCTFRVAEGFFGIDVLHVQEIIREQPTTRVPLAPNVVRGLMNLRGQIVTALDLRQRLGLPERAAGAAAVNVVVRTADGAVSLLADEIGDVLEVAEDAFERPPETLRGAARELVVGAYKLPGQLLLALDLDRVADLRCADGSNAA